MNMLTKKNFKCKRCAKCCKKYLIKLYDRDIERIQKKYPKEYFVEKLEIGPINDYILKKVNGKCIFLKKNKQYFCKIYTIRPKICKQYPFFGEKIENCKP